MAFDFSTLITDRSASDLELLRDLLSTPVREWTEAEKAEFNLARSKGAYNYTDLNRVTQCMEYLDETLRSYGYQTGYQRIRVPHKGGSGLPEGYTELEYIESTGTQHIDTGFKPNNNSRVIVDIYVPEQSTYPKAVFGSRNGVSSSVASFVLWAFESSQFRSDYNSVNTSVNVSVPGRHTIDKNKNVCTIDDTTVSSATASFQSNYSLALFGQNDADGIDERKVAMQLYSCQIYDNDVLIRAYMPCQGPSGDIGLYDTENNQFYGNAGTGTFTAGPEIPPEPDEVLDPYTWYESDTPTDTQMAQYLSNVLAIWDTIMGDPTLPETIENLTLDEANQIEAALIEINTAIEQIIAGMARSNSFTFWSGNRPFPTARSNLGRNWAELDAMNTEWKNWQVADWYLLLYGNLEAEGVVS